MASASEEYGARNSVVVMPAAPASASCVWSISRVIRSSLWYDRSTCVKVWMPISLPWSTRSFTMLG